VGEVISLEGVARRRRRHEAFALHARCRVILSDSVRHARAAAHVTHDRERAIWLARLRKLEELEAWAVALG